MVQEIANWISSQDPDVVKTWGPITIGLLTVLASLVIGTLTICAALLTIRNQRLQNKYQNEANIRQFNLVKSKEERDEIIKKLNSFYGPLKELRTQSRILYNKFALGLKAQYKEKTGHHFRTLGYLLEGKKFTGQDDEILSEILRVGRKELELIETQSGVVDKPELQDLLGKLCAHIRLLQLAYDGKLSGPATSFEDVVFPLAIDGAIESAVLRLQDKMAKLSKVDEVMLPQKHPHIEDDRTIRFYDQHADAYANKTLFLDLVSIYAPFLELVPPSGRLLDAGCGAGRDTRFFIERGYVVISFDASTGMVRKCQEYPHAYCVHLSFSEIAFKEEFDGVWACASLLHLPFEKAKSAVVRLATALKLNGIMFLSVRAGNGDSRENGRYFQYYDDKMIDTLFAHDPRLEVLRAWHSTSVGPDGDQSTAWINVLIKRRSRQDLRNSEGQDPAGSVRTVDPSVTVTS